jgi:HSP20 family protein
MAKRSGTKQSKETKSAKLSEVRKEASELASQLTSTPMTLMKRFGEEMERVFNDFGVDRNWLNSIAGGEFGKAAWAPQVEMFERDGQLVVRADLPGLTKNDVNVEVSDGGITIEGERKSEKEEKREGFYSSERTYGRFYRRLPLPQGVDGTDANATFNNGVLEITMEAPKRIGSKARRLEITDESRPRTKQKAA